jgi:glutamine amidotransferase
MAIVVIDYHKGNLSSVERGLAAAGGATLVSDDPSGISGADALVLPGVGSFEDAMGFLRGSGQDVAILSALSRGVPFLGICLGLQLLFERGDERSAGHVGSNRWVEGLGLLPGSCTRLRSDVLKVPHVGWDQVRMTPTAAGCPLLDGLESGCNMYFTHSYALADDVPDPIVAARTDYVRDFPSVVWRGNVFGCQFHPEKSSAHGLLVLRNFVSLVDRFVHGEEGEGRP